MELLELTNCSQLLTKSIFTFLAACAIIIIQGKENHHSIKKIVEKEVLAMEKEMLGIVLKAVEKSLFNYLEENNDLPTLYKAINTLNEIGNGLVIYLLKTVPIYHKNEYCEIEMLVGQEFYIERNDGKDKVIVYEMIVEI